MSYESRFENRCQPLLAKNQNIKTEPLKIFDTCQNSSKFQSAKMFSFLTDDFFENNKYLFIVQRVALSLLGFWPGSEFIHPWQIVFAIVSALEILIYGIFQVNFCINNMGDLVTFLNGVTPLFTQFMVVQKIFVIVWKRRDIKKILDHLQRSFDYGLMQFRLFQVRKTSVYFCRLSKKFEENQRKDVQIVVLLLCGASNVWFFNWSFLYGAPNAS